MKSSILICELERGALHSVALPTFAAIKELADKVRAERTVDIGKRAVPVLNAVVVTQNAQSAQVVKTISCRADARRAAIDAEAARAALDVSAEK